jgi:hypothetical protein
VFEGLPKGVMQGGNSRERDQENLKRKIERDHDQERVQESGPYKRA